MLIDHKAAITIVLEFVYVIMEILTTNMCWNLLEHFVCFCYYCYYYFDRRKIGLNKQFNELKTLDVYKSL